MRFYSHNFDRDAEFVERTMIEVAELNALAAGNGLPL